MGSKWLRRAIDSGAAVYGMHRRFSPRILSTLDDGAGLAGSLVIIGREASGCVHPLLDRGSDFGRTLSSVGRLAVAPPGPHRRPFVAYEAS